MGGEDGMTTPPAQATMPAVVRTYDEEMRFLTKVSDTCYTIQPGFVPNMRVPGVFYVNERLSSLMFDELQQYIQAGGVGGFIPAVKQIANVAGLPGIVGVRVERGGLDVGEPPEDLKVRRVSRGLVLSMASARSPFPTATAATASPSVRPGQTGAATVPLRLTNDRGDTFQTILRTGNVAAMDMEDPEAVVSPGKAAGNLNL